VCGQIGSLRREPGVIAEGPFEHQILARVDVPFDHDLRFGGDLEVGGHSLGQPYRLAAQKSREQILVDRRRQGRRRRIDGCGVAAQCDRDRHRLAALRHRAPMRRADFVPLPVHRQLVLAEHLHAIHPHIPHS